MMFDAEFLIERVKGKTAVQGQLFILDLMVKGPKSIDKKTRDSLLDLAYKGYDLDVQVAREILEWMTLWTGERMQKVETGEDPAPPTDPLAWRGRTCVECGERKLYTEFSNLRGMPSSRLFSCKTCELDND